MFSPGGKKREVPAKSVYSVSDRNKMFNRW